VALGLRLLEKALNARGSSLEAILEEQWGQFLAENHFAGQEDLFHELALGSTLANIVAGKLAPHPGHFPDSLDDGEAITIAGSEGNALSFGACCLPVPGDKIMAYVSTDKGLVVHRVSCSNVREFRKHPDRCVDVIWAPITHGMFPVSVRIMTRNTPGVLANVSASIGKAGSNIETVAQPEANPETATLLFNISVKDRDHMARVMRRLRRNSNVIRVQRVG